MKSKFKRGDIVVCINPGDRQNIKMLQLYTVVDISFQGEYEYCYLKEVGDGRVAYYSHRFEKPSNQEVAKLLYEQ